jgi:hypothetical protein
MGVKPSHRFTEYLLKGYLKLTSAEPPFAFVFTCRRYSRYTKPGQWDINTGNASKGRVWLGCVPGVHGECKPLENMGVLYVGLPGQLIPLKVVETTKRKGEK